MSISLYAIVPMPPNWRRVIAEADEQHEAAMVKQTMAKFIATNNVLICYSKEEADKVAEKRNMEFGEFAQHLVFSFKWDG